MVNHIIMTYAMFTCNKCNTMSKFVSLFCFFVMCWLGLATQSFAGQSKQYHADNQVTKKNTLALQSKGLQLTLSKELSLATKFIIGRANAKNNVSDNTNNTVNKDEGNPFSEENVFNEINNDTFNKAEILSTEQVLYNDQIHSSDMSSVDLGLSESQNSFQYMNPDQFKRDEHSEKSTIITGILIIAVGAFLLLAYSLLA
jgi:hypothetical protein